MPTETKVNPEELLVQLKSGAKSIRTKKSLDIIHQICKEQRDRGSNDFSYEMIGRLSEKIGGPKAQPIRNVTGAIYRALIDAWETSVVKASNKKSHARGQGLAEDIVSLTDDPVLRILVQSYISENKRLKNENQVLKVAAKGMLVIDMSVRGQAPSSAKTFSAHSFLHAQELRSLSDAISGETMERHGWKINEGSGAVTRGPLPVFSPGFVSAIRKILNASDEES